MRIRYLLYRPLRSYALLGLCVLPFIAAASVLHARAVRSGLDAAMLQVVEMQRAERMASHFEARYNTLAANAEPHINPRVSWTDSLHSAFADFPDIELAFSIADPALLAVEFTGRVSKVLVREFLLQLSASLHGDAELIRFLKLLHDLNRDFLHNRSCNVKREETSSALRLNCVYSILNLPI